MPGDENGLVSHRNLNPANQRRKRVFLWGAIGQVKRFGSRGQFPLAELTTAPDFRAVRTVVYPGSFDPLTNGHLDVIQRAARLFDRVIVAVAQNAEKHPLFTPEERCALAVGATKRLKNVEVRAFDGLLVDYVRGCQAQAVIRGLRAVSDFEFEFQMALMNRKLDERVETIFMMPKDTYTFLSSRLVKEIAKLGGDVHPFVPPNISRALQKRLDHLAASGKG